MHDDAIATTTRPSGRRRYRVAMYGCLAVGAAGYFFGLELASPLVALAVYWAGFLGFLGVWKGSSVTLYDERHEAMEAGAAKRTVGVAGATLILAGPPLPALQAAGYEPPTLVLGALYGYAALFAVYGAVYLAVHYRT